MKSIKAVISALMAVGVVAMSVSGAIAQAGGGTPPAGKPGQGGPGGPGGPIGGGRQRMTPAQRLDKMATDLKLTDKQKKDILPILEARGKEMKAMRDDTKLTDDQKKVKRGELMKKYNDQVGKVLTADQKKKLEEMMKRRGPGGRGAPGTPPAGTKKP